MESQYVTMIIKIVISLLLGLTIVLPSSVHGAALMGGHIDNKNNITGLANQTISEYTQNRTNNVSNQIININKTEQKEATRPAYSSLPLSADIPLDATQQKEKISEKREEIPDPSPLILPGYNLPEHLFNNGKPFYVEKDPLTGKIDFNSKTPAGKTNDEYDYFSDENIDIYDKANIDRKDGSLSSHRPNDVNQLTPNFHDFLNLPVKYNSDKYVYPLISNSYANTKIQGNVNNHKYSVTTYKPTLSPNYFTSDEPTYHYTKYKDSKPPMDYGNKYTSRTTVPTTTTRNSDVYSTTKLTNLMESPMSHSTYETTEEDYDTDMYMSTETPGNNVYLTTRQPNQYTTTTTATTKRPLSIFEQLFGDYDEPKPTESSSKPPSLFANLPSNKHKYDNEIVTNRPKTVSSTTITSKPNYVSPTTENNHAVSGSAQENTYEYEEDYEDPTRPINVHLPVNKEVEHPTASKYPIRPDYASPPQRIPNSEYSDRETPTTTENIRYSTKPSVTTTTDSYNNIKHNVDYYETSSEYTEYEDTTKPNRSEYYFTGAPQPTKVTSLPLGENHLQNNRQSIIALTNNLREQLNHERVESSTKTIPIQNTYQPNYNNFNPKLTPVRSGPPSTSNIHIAPDQDTVSFVVGNQQNVQGHINPTSAKPSPYDQNPFRPVYSTPERSDVQNSVSYTVQAIPEMYKPQTFPGVVGSAVNIQPIQNSEASLTIGMPLNNNRKVIPGQVVDEKLDLENDKIEYSKVPGSKIVFPDEKLSTYAPTLMHKPVTGAYPNREVLKLNSKPMFHQLPSDLTPPNESEPMPLPPPPPSRIDRPRPPWDPRPGHFFNGRPEYARPPRPSLQKQGDVYKRIDVLPNILPQFRPNAKAGNGHYYDGHGPMNNGYMRQPLLERPSNRPIGFFEKMHPPPQHQPPKRLQEHRKGPQHPQHMDHDMKGRQPGGRYPVEERISQDLYQKPAHENFGYYQGPPKVHIANRRIGNLETEVETLQMIQAKESNKNDMKVNVASSLKTSIHGKESTEKPLYVVYPVNSAPLKLNVLDNDKKEAVVIGTRAELPLPPSKISHDYTYDQKPLLKPKDRNDSPILKPHPRPQTFPIKSDFPYILERPDPSVLNPPVPETPSNNGNNLEISDKYHDHKQEHFESSNQWSSVGDNLEPRIVVGGSGKNKYTPDQISATLKTYTEKPIAVAYTPTEQYHPTSEKYSMPNYANPVISEIRPGIVDNADIHEATIGGQSQSSEITVSAVMHTHPQADMATQHMDFINRNKQKLQKPSIIEGTSMMENHKSDLDTDTSHVPAKLDFQAPFQASVNVDSVSSGWSIVREPAKSEIDRADVDETTLAVETASDFDIENFKPQLFGGFKPLYSYSESENKKDVAVEERQERKV